MKWKPSADTADGYLEIGGPMRHWARTDIVAEAPNASVLIDYDKDGNILGIEVVA